MTSNRRRMAIFLVALAAGAVTFGIAANSTAHANSHATAHATPRVTSQQNQPPQQAQTPQPAAAAQASGATQTAEQKFKNIQVLKTIPADQLIPSMQFIATSLGVECEFCHVEHERDKDDKKTKLIARKMIAMQMAIDNDNFKGELRVTCYSCHRGAIRPESIPAVAMESAPNSAAGAATGAKAHPPAPAPSEKESADSAAATAAALPDAKTILAKYLESVGGAAALNKITNREMRGEIGGMQGAPGEQQEFAITIVAEAPEKRYSTVFRGKDPSVTAFNGAEGWLSSPNGVRPMSATERQAARIDAEFYFAERLPEMYQDFKVEDGGEVSGAKTYLVSARGKDTPPLRLYFDQQTGLLVRLVRLNETPLGALPTQIDYADYRDVDGVKIPWRWTLARPGGQFTIQLQSVKSNVTVDEKMFVMPPPSAPAGPHEPMH